jgi:HK97 family phage portal protein
MWPFSRRKTEQPEQRAITYQDVWGSGADTLNTAISQERALQLIPVYASTRLIADSVSALPLQAFRQTQDGSKSNIGLPALFTNPDPYGGTTYDWMFRCMTSLLLRGNAYGLVTGHDKYGYPSSIEWLHPDHVSISHNIWEPGFARPTWYYLGRELTAREFIHIPAYVLPGQVQGISPIKAYKMSVDIGLNAMSFGSDWFHNGSIPAALLVAPDDVDVDDDDAITIKQRFKVAAANRDLAVISGGFKYQQVSVPPEESQFIQTLKLTATQIASIYGVPPEMIGGETGSSLTYKTAEQQSINFLSYTLRPWITRLEMAFSQLLPRPQYVKFRTDEIIRTDTLTRHEVYQIDRTIGLRSINEIRSEEDLPPIPGGDDYAPGGGNAIAQSSGA